MNRAPALPGHSHPRQRLRHRFTAIHNLLAGGKVDSQLWQVRFTLWVARFTTSFTLFGRETARMAKSVQTSPFPRETSPNPFFPLRPQYSMSTSLSTHATAARRPSISPDLSFSIEFTMGLAANSGRKWSDVFRRCTAES